MEQSRPVQGQSLRQAGGVHHSPADLAFGNIGTQLDLVGNSQARIGQLLANDRQLVGHRKSHDTGDAQFVDFPFHVVHGHPESSRLPTGQIGRSQEATDLKRDVAPLGIVFDDPRWCAARCRQRHLPGHLSVNEHVAGLIPIAKLPRVVVPSGITDPPPVFSDPAVTVAGPECASHVVVRILALVGTEETGPR